MMTKTTLSLLATLLLSSAAQAGPLIDLNAEASRPAANDLIQVSVFSEASGPNPADLARKVNQSIADALKVIKATPGVTVKTGRQHTYPVYGQNQKIDGWRMRSELAIESKESASVSELIGQLQQMRLAVGNISQSPSTATRLAVEEESTKEAIRAFQKRAASVAEVFGKPYRIKQMSIQQNGSPPMPIMRPRVAMMAAEAAPMPLEAGESLITTQISGQIELDD
jgi:predicted secreted protein